MTQYVEAQNVKRGTFPIAIDGDDVRRYVVTDVTIDASWAWLTLRSPIGGLRDRTYRLTPTEQITVSH